MRTEKEIDREIARLCRLIPVGDQAVSSRRAIKIAIAVLAGNKIETTPEEQCVVDAVKSWQEGRDNVRPSSGWGELVK